MSIEETYNITSYIILFGTGLVILLFFIAYQYNEYLKEKKIKKVLNDDDTIIKQKKLNKTKYQDKNYNNHYVNSTSKQESKSNFIEEKFDDYNKTREIKIEFQEEEDKKTYTTSHTPSSSSFKTESTNNHSEVATSTIESGDGEFGGSGSSNDW